MNRTIIKMENKYLQTSLDMVRRTFTNSENAENAQVVVNIIEEIRTMSSYVPELELVMVNDVDEVIGYVMFSKLFLDGKMQDELLVLNPVAVKTELQRQHISKDIIEKGFEIAKEMNFKAVVVEGNPMNYRNRGFVTSADFGIVAAECVGLPAPECLMVKELVDGGLDNIGGKYSYADYEALK